MVSEIDKVDAVVTLKTERAAFEKAGLVRCNQQAAFIIMEDKETRTAKLYTTYTYLAGPETEVAQVKLYRVSRPDHVEKYVLAENPDRAILQATCGTDRSNLLQEKGCVVVELPFRIQGWGDHDF